MRTMYRAYVLEHEGYTYPQLLCQTEVIGDDEEKEYNERQLQDYIDDGYTLESALITTEKELYLKFKLKYRLGDLRHTHQRYVEYIEDLKRKNTPKEVIDDTIACQTEYEEVLMKQVASVVSRCMREEIEVEDELAISCYNWRQAQMLNC